MSVQGNPIRDTHPCPVCGGDIDVEIQFTTHYAPDYGADEYDVEFTGDYGCPSGCVLTDDQWQDVLVAVSERVS